MLEIWLLLMTVEPMVTHADVGTFTLNVVSQNDTDSHVNPALLLPALELAFETVNAKYGQWFKLNHTIHSKECHDEHSLMKFGIDAVNKTCDEPPTNGFIGPSNDQHTIRFQLFSYSWSKPIITIAGMARIQTKFNDRIRRNMGRRAPMTRMGYYYYYDVARFIELIAARFRWGKVGYLATFTRSHDRRSVATCGVAGDAWYCRRLRDIAEYNDDSGTNTTFFTVSSIMETLPVNPEPADIRAFLKARIGVRHGVILLCASPSDVRKIMLAAYDVGMTRSGEYVFFSIDVSTNLEESRPWKMGEDDCKDHYPNASDWKERCEEDNQKASEAYRALKIITLKAPNSARYREIEKTIQSKAHEYKTATGREYELNRFVAAYYDAVMLYALALNETLTDDPSITPKTMDGYNLSKRMWNRTFDGIAGKIVIDENGDRHSDYSVLATNDDGVLQAVAQYYGVSNELVHENDWLWIGGGPPLDTPKCGYDNSKCPDKTLHWSVYVAAAFVLTFGAFGFFSFLMCRRLKLEHELAAMAWRIQWDEITGQQSILSMLKIKSPTSSNRELRATPSAISLDNEEHETRFARTTKFRTLISTEALMIQGSVVAIKQLPISKSKLDMTRPMLVELKRMKDMQHDHIARFVGACIDYPHYCVVTEYCSKGSLQDILENKEVGLDEMMMLSLVHDLVKAMDFIHSTDFRSHGNLKSSNCVVDSRFVLKVKDFGLCYLRSHCDPADDDGSPKHWKSRFPFFAYFLILACIHFSLADIYF